MVQGNIMATRIKHFADFRSRTWAARGEVLAWCLLFCGFGLVGCTSDRQAGTEVGNPEVTVVARFGLTQDTTDVQFESLKMKVMGVDYVTSDNVKGSIWVRDTGYLIDWVSGTGHISQSLPTLRMADDAWQKADIRLWSPGGTSKLDSNTRFADAKEPQWMKWTSQEGDSTVRCLFYLAANSRLRMSYSEKTMKSWHDGDTVKVTTLFNVSKWMQNCSFTGLTRRKGTDSVWFYVISPDENSDTYNSLVNIFADCFQADSISKEEK